jgi:uncharacterized protein
MPSMLPPHLRPILHRLEVDLRARFGDRLRKVTLFGSYARGEANEDSDVDVLVLVDELAVTEIAIVADAATAVELATGAALAALPMSSRRYGEMVASGRGLATEIERDGASP